MLRRIMSQTVLSGSPFFEMITRLLVNSYSMGPLVPSETLRRYQKTLWMLFAMDSIVIGFFSVLSRTVLSLIRPAYLYFFFRIIGVVSQQSVSDGTETKYRRSGQFSTVSIKSGLLRIHSQFSGLQEPGPGPGENRIHGRLSGTG